MPENNISTLLIEDNPIHVRLIQELLSEATNPSFDLVSADSLAKGIGMLSEHEIDVVLLDLVLPDSEELDTFIRLRASNPDVPVVILTSLDDVTLAARAVEVGAQDYLVKAQINSALLVRSIRYAI